MPKTPCTGCESSTTRRYVVALGHDDRDEEGQVIADIEIYLCDECEERAGDLLLAFPLILEREVAATGD